MSGAGGIAGLLPHAGSMLLIDEVVSWDPRHIHCRSTSHRNPLHPLRRQGRLSALHLIEYAAQAMALHGGLEARSRNRTAAPGLLASVRDVRLAVQRIDDIDDPLEIRAEQQLAQPAGWLYRFSVHAGGRLLAQGRVTVMTAAAAA